MLKNSIPYVDLRGKTPIDLLRAYPDKAHALVKGARRMYGPLSYGLSKLALPVTDRMSHEWLTRSGNPYLYEIESFAEILETPGIHTLNLCYEWGCTSGVWRTGDTLSMLRLLDWPFPGIGHHVMVVQQQGKAGAYYNVTWPGMAGVFNAMAPNRFSASINMAPMRKHGRGYIGDWWLNRQLVKKEWGLPPSHLLRRVFERAENYEAAKKMLMDTPIAVPAIFILAGVNPREGCIIERLETSAEAINLAAGFRIAAANHFTSELATSGKWRPRMKDSEGRFRQCNQIGEPDLEQRHFDWLQPPIVNRFTRLCVLSDASTQRLQVQGFEGITPVTSVFNLPQVAHEIREAI
jgi:hypothetical protein